MANTTETNVAIEAGDTLSPQEAMMIADQATTVLKPHSTITTRELLFGRMDQLRQAVDTTAEHGLHGTIYGERGVGKSSLVLVAKTIIEAMDPDRVVIKVSASESDDFCTLWIKALNEVSFDTLKPTSGMLPPSNQVIVVPLVEYLGVPDRPSPHDIQKVLGRLKESVFIFDEFDRPKPEKISEFTDLIKMLSDYDVASTVILVGVGETVDQLIQNHASIRRAIVQIPVKRMIPEALLAILHKAEEVLRVSFSDPVKGRIVQMSQGLPHYTHLIGLHGLRAACQDFSRTIQIGHFDAAVEESVNKADQDVRTKFQLATDSPHKDAIFEQVLLACAIAASTSGDSAGFFRAQDVLGPLRSILNRDSVNYSTFNPHLGLFCEEKRGPVLFRQGRKQSFSYRFVEPLLPPYVVMRGISKKQISEDQAKELLTGLYPIPSETQPLFLQSPISQ